MFKEDKILNKKRNNFYQAAFFIGIIVTLWEMMIFDKTIVPISLLFLIIGGIAVLATYIDFDNFRKTYDLKGWNLYFFAFLQNIVSWGSIICSILLLFCINHNEIIKGIEFPRKYLEEMEEYNYVYLTTKKGFIYWDIILNQRIEK